MFASLMISRFVDEEDENTFLSLNTTKSVKSVLSHKFEFYYRISGSFSTLLEVCYFILYND